eukprot:scaffold3555_cov58-Phaeocystis_antarctica.AAC.5
MQVARLKREAQARWLRAQLRAAADSDAPVPPTEPNLSRTWAEPELQLSSGAAATLGAGAAATLGSGAAPTWAIRGGRQVNTRIQSRIQG